MKLSLALLTGLLVLVSGTLHCRAVIAHIAPVDIGLGSYNSSMDGFGLILNDFDLGAVDAGLAGILLDVTTTDIGGSSLIETGANGSFRVADAEGSWTFSFSSPVGFVFSSAESNGPFTLPGVISFAEGEGEAFSGSPGGFTIIDPDPIDTALTLGAASIENGSTGTIDQSFAYGAASGVTSLTWTHSDSVTPFSSTGLQAWIIPEPSRALLSLVGIAAITLRRRMS